MFRWLFRCLSFSAALWLLTFRPAPVEPIGPPGAQSPAYSIELLASLPWPAEIQCAPDSRCFVATVHDPADEERSAIWLIQPDGSQQRLYRGPSYDPTLLGEKGLTGLALHPRFAQDDRLFFYWNPPNHSRSEPTYSVISSIRSDGSDYRELWNFTTGSFTDAHVAGGLVTYSENGHDYLFVAIGEYGAGGSQDVTKTQGKIHRFEIITDTLQAPSDNPFYNTPNAVQSIWAVGFRNPFRLTRDSVTGKVYVDENGFTCSDRVYLLVRGGNYGWPLWDACQDDPGYEQPIYEFRPAMGITDIEVYHGPLEDWDGKVFLCGFNAQPLRAFSVAPNNLLVNERIIASGGAGCRLALGTRADGALLYSWQGDQGRVFIIRPAAPQPRLAAVLSTDTVQPAAGQRVHYTLDVANLGSWTSFTATLPLPDQLAYLPGSTFGGALYLSDTHQLQWTAALEISRSLRAGFAATSFVTGSPITTTALITDRQGLTYTTSVAITLRAGSALETKVTPNRSGVASGQPFMLIYQLWNRSITDTTFALTTSLPGEAQFVRGPFTATVTYDDAAHTLNWQRALKADRAVLAAAVISATRSVDRTIGFTTTLTTEALTADTLLEFINRVMLDPIMAFLPLIGRQTSAAIDYRVVTNDQPFERRGTPPGSIDNLAAPTVCQQCHVYTATNIYASWSTSAHGYGASDPVFNAALFNAKRQVKDVEHWCTQCHQPENWLQGHPLDEQNRSGITCSVCHRAIAPDSADVIDQEALDRAQRMELIPPRWREIGGSGALIIDHYDIRRGANFTNLGAPHSVWQSPYQGESALCGSCHSVYAPHLAPDPVTGEFVLGRPDVAHGENPFFLQSTYPEWLNSQYPGQDKQCQDCHMPRKQGYVALPEPGSNAMPRLVPMHTFAGGNLFILDIFDRIGGLADTGEARAAVTNLLTQSVALTSTINGSMLDVEVMCLAGHKCPTGYEEGRAWILQVEQLDGAGQRVACSGCWDEVKHTISGYGAGPLDPTYDPELTEFAVHFGVTGTHALQLGMIPGASFNLALNNTVIRDTRIPPCGWEAAAYQALGIAPTVPYAPGSCMATVHYQIKPGATQIVVSVLHWSHTTPYLEFLREVGGEFGRTVWNAWQANLNAGQGRPVAITTQTVNVPGWR
ncbi:Aldose sugar dehydrogenase YliI [Thermoflexales bacterium]|nr:Aldose sugar dehydrogenase YliI [Thermoflexales bacterium]